MPVNVIGTLKPKNNGKFPVAEAVDILVSGGLRLDKALDNKADLSTVSFALAGKANNSDITNLQAQIDLLITPVTQDAEVQNARVDANGTSYVSLKARLDAEQGKVATLTSSLYSITNVYDYQDNTLDKYINSEGTIIDASTLNAWTITDYMPVTGGASIEYSGLTNVGSAPYSAWYNSSKTLISTFKQATGTNTLTVPSNAKYVRFSVGNPDQQLFECFSVVSKIPDLTEVYSEIEFLSDEIDVINEELTTNVTIYHEGNITNDKYIDQNGDIQDNPSQVFGVTDYIDVRDCDSIQYTGLRHIGSESIQSATYDSSKQLIAVFKQGTGTQSLNVSNVGYVRFTVAISTVVGDDPEISDYENFYVNAPINKIDDLSNKITVPYRDITWCVLGDSLTQKTSMARTAYYDWIKQDTGINIVNLGRSGEGYARGDYFYTAISQCDPSTFDFMTIFGSGNDCNIPEIWQDGRTWQEALGNITDNGTMSLCGYINRAIDKFYEVAPLKKLGIVTPTPWKNYANANGTLNKYHDTTGGSMDDYSNALVAICKLRGIPCLDLYHSSGLRPWDNAFLAEYYNENGVQDTGVHPNSKGHKWISQMFAEFIKKYLIS